MNSSERLSPNALTRIKTSPLFGVGIGRLSILRTSGPPASWITAAFIVVIARSLRLRCKTALCARGIGGGEAVARDFPCAVDLLKHEEFLVRFGALCARALTVTVPAELVRANAHSSAT